MSIIQIISLFVSTLTILLGILVLANNPKGRPNQIFFALIICFIAWTTTNMMADMSQANPSMDFWIKASIVGPLFMPFLLFYFLIIFPKKIEVNILEKVFLALLIIPPIVSLFFVPTPFNVSDVRRVGNEIVATLGIMYTMVSIELVLSFIGIIYNTTRKRSFLDKKDKKQLWFILIAFIATSIAGSLTNNILASFGIFAYANLGPLFTIFITIVISMAIIKNKLFNISFFTTLVLVLIILILSSIELFFYRDAKEFSIKISTLLVILPISYFLIRNMILEMERKKQVQELANRLKDANDELKKLDQLKNDFIHLAVHEINTPMTSILGYLSMVLDEKIVKVDKKAEIYLQKVYASSKRLASVVANFLDTVKIEGGKLKLEFTKVKMEELFQEILMEYEEKAKAKNNQIKIRSFGLNKNAEIEVDRDKIKEAFINLIDNAIKFTSNGLIEVSISLDLETCKIYIKDSGTGIPPEKLDKIFDKFYQAEPCSSQQYCRTSTGLGLYIAKSIIEMHGGTIRVESILGEGTKFIVSLPVKR